MTGEDIHPAVDGDVESSSGLPQISVIIPVKDDLQRLRKCLRALRAQTLSADAFEIIVVDNNSSEPVQAAVADEPDIKVLQELQPGSYAARNRGIAEARGRAFAFTDSDCVPASDWLEKGWQALLAAPEAGVVAGRITLFEEEAPTDPREALGLAFERLFGFGKFDQERFVRQGHCITANWFSWSDVVREIGGFDGNLKSRGDFELSSRMRQQGFELIYDPEVVIAHPLRANRDEIMTKHRRVVGGKWQSIVGRGRPLRLGWNVSLGTLRRLRRVVLQRDLAPRRKLDLAAFVVQMWWMSIAEIHRLERGGTPETR